MIPPLLFYLFATFLLIAAGGVVFIKNPIYNILFLILAFLNASGLFLMAGAEFIAMIFAIVYVGAVAVLFLFIIMMLDIQQEVSNQRTGNYFKIALIAATIFGIELVGVAYQWWHLPQASDLVAFPITNQVNNTMALGQILYTHYFFIFQLAGLTLLIAMVGAIVLVHNMEEKRITRHQKISTQLRRNKENSLVIVKPDFNKGVKI